MTRLWLTLLLGILPFTTAMADTAEQYFARGNEAFKQEHYQEAIELFLKAEQSGMKVPALYYNLGASYFKLQDYDKAEFYFRKLLKTGLRHLALYNLAVIEKKRGNLAAAEQQFQALLSAADTPPQIKALARRQLSDLRFQSRDRSTVFLSGGYDSNISNVASGAGTGVSDLFVQIYGVTEGVLSGSTNDNRRYELAFYNQTYLNSTTYDMTDLKLGLIHERRVGDKLIRTGQAFSTSTYGTSPYLNQLSFDHRVTANNHQSRYRLDFYSSATTTYAYLNGYRFRYRSTSQTTQEGYRYRHYYEFEYNDRADSGTASYSPIRNTLRWYRYTPKNAGVYSRMDFAVRMSNYPVFSGTQRNDLRTRFAYRHYNEGQGGVFSWGTVFTVNMSTLSSSSYNKLQLMFTYQWL